MTLPKMPDDMSATETLLLCQVMRRPREIPAASGCVMRSAIVRSLVRRALVAVDDDGWLYRSVLARLLICY